MSCGCDQKWGRDRDLIEPEYVAYPRDTEERSVRVLNEKTGVSDVYYESEFLSDSYGAGAAKRWFAKHPAPKPWHSATHGDVWALSIENRGPVAYLVTQDTDEFYTSNSSMPITSPYITHAERIWPKQ